MSKLRIVIADDERPAREYLKALLTGLEDIEIVAEAETGAAAVESIRAVRPDLALLDLQMPEVSGIDAVRLLRRDQMPLVAFVTAYDEFAVQAFELNAVDYLLKPVERSRLAETVARARERLEHADWRDVESERITSAADLVDPGSAHGPIERIPVRRRDEIIFVPVSDVASVTADGELLHITDSVGGTHTINFRLKDLELRLDPNRFIRLSRGVIVNIDMIDRVSPMPGGTYTVFLVNGSQFAASRLQSRIVREKLLKI